jgi:hypothetical protein
MAFCFSLHYSFIWFTDIISLLLLFFFYFLLYFYSPCFHAVGEVVVSFCVRNMGNKKERHT